MSDLEGLWRWPAELAKRLPMLSGGQVRGLAGWRPGVGVGRACALTMGGPGWGAPERGEPGAGRQRPTGGGQPGAGRQRLGERCYGGARKRGSKRQAVEVEACFPALLAWVVSSWSGRQVALAMDATTLGDQFVVLAISVVYRGCAVPVAWS